MTGAIGACVRTCDISCWSKSGGVNGFTPLTENLQRRIDIAVMNISTSPILNTLLVSDIWIAGVKLNDY